jgi:hypothetical protein
MLTETRLLELIAQARKQQEAHTPKLTLNIPVNQDLVPAEMGSAPLHGAQRVIAEKTVCVLLVRGESPAGERIYAYLAVRADRLDEFMEAQKRGTFYPEEYGIIVASGTGEPNEEVRERMTREYGFNHEAMLNIDDRENAQDLTRNLSSYAAAASKHP